MAQLTHESPASSSFGSGPYWTRTSDPGAPSDFDGDGVVAVPDLLNLLAAREPCP